MVYRIDYQHFLTHAIDHFTSDELTHFQYAVISAKIKNARRSANVAKIPELYPTPEIVESYAQYEDKKILEKMYMELLDPPKGSEDIWVQNKIYDTFINPLLLHHDIVIICDRIENDYIDVLCSLLKKRYSIDVIDLNHLFSKGYVGPIYIDRKDIWDKAVDVRRQALTIQKKALESTREGRLGLLNIMTKKQKIEQLKELGISVTKADKDNLDKLLVEEWVDNDGE